ncbi:hypothetical protein Mal52_40930 [Symmachiella dynata]|uniref:Class I SAM-dependent methyltransferase n=1 Tax=Symmachiella dynata TaxID=2527995 RepID=A0A517ZSZ2_9PLAN|nr:class I SAM-dependent methyltransferase [Symmachiella dynata]QDU45599.1 hypothetical protein Mal52_40930 [Symmachiella dynata]
MSKVAQRGALIELIRDHFGQPQKGAQIGVCDGKTSEALLGSFGRLELLMIDKWSDQKDCRPAIQNTSRFSSRRQIFSCPTCHPKALELAPTAGLDFVIIDAGHLKNSYFRSMQDWFDKVKLGGLFCGCDYGKSDQPGVIEAVQRWAKKMGRGKADKFHVTKLGHVWWTTRVAE